MASEQEQLEQTDVELLRHASAGYAKLRQEIAKVIIGQEGIVRQALAAIFCQGHTLIIGVPGLAKTLLVKTLSQVLGWSFKRIQFTPDMMPADIIGMELLQEDRATGARNLHFMHGPIFANMILADEINRTPPKTQAALLQAMQEYSVTIAGLHYPLEKPFFVLGTQNPIESEGTYPLPEAQLDRFMFKIQVDYPTLAQEIDVALSTTSGDMVTLEPVLHRKDILETQAIVRDVIVARPVAAYAVRLARATRPKEDNSPPFVKQYVTWGAGPRACQALLLGAKACALLDGRANVSVEDIRFIAKPALRHRLVLNFTAESENVGPDNVIEKLIEMLPEAI
ncbi:MAG: MoxR family ATPase [Lentisphaerae bacterium]|nr:MoxR family ATPase [Lentisphaerota bacterium]